MGEVSKGGAVTHPELSMVKWGMKINKNVIVYGAFAVFILLLLYIVVFGGGVSPF